MSDLELGKREIEREHLGLFLDAYQLATDESFSEMYDSETPDFIGRDETGRTVGIEIAQLRFSPDERHMRRIEPPEPHDMDAWWRLLELMHRKDQKLTKGYYEHLRIVRASRVCRNGATRETKPWIAEFGLPAPARIHAALD